jgi:hypothetical protein
VLALVKPSSNVSDIDLKQSVDVSAVQSKTPFRIVTVSVQEYPPEPIPGYGDSAERENEPFAITRCETVEEYPISGAYANPDPMPAPSDPLALIFPPEMVRLTT